MTTKKLPSEKTMRKVYFRIFGKEFDSPERKIHPLPIELAYSLAIAARKRIKFTKLVQSCQP
jgi:hypothetical protein